MINPGPDDLLRKADALMARHRPGQAEPARYADIPVLEEIVEIAPADADLPLLTECIVPAPPSQDQLQKIAAEIRVAVLADLHPDIQTLIEEKLKDSLAPRVERLFTELRDQLQAVAREVLDEAVRAAIEREMDRRK